MRSVGFFILLAAYAAAQPQNVSQVVMYSTLTTNQSVKPVTAVNGQSNPVFTPNDVANCSSPSCRVTGTLPASLLSIYTDVSGSGDINTVGNYKVANASALASALSTNIAIALSVIPLESPTSGVILKMDPATGAVLPVSNTLGPIFTQRAETLGKGKFYIGFTHQNYHFNSLDGHSLNGVTVLYGGKRPVRAERLRYFPSDHESRLGCPPFSGSRVPDLRSDQESRRLRGFALGSRRCSVHSL
jgi:hypothetical protein